MKPSTLLDKALFLGGLAVAVYGASIVAYGIVLKILQ